MPCACNVSGARPCWLGMSNTRHAPAARSSARIVAAIARAPPPGNAASMSTAENGPREASAAIAAGASAAVLASAPHAVRYPASTSRVNAWSSTTSTDAPVSGGRAAAPSARPRRIVKVNVVPWPGVEVKAMSPSMRCTRRRAMASPSPVPPCRRVSDWSPCWNASKMRAPASGGIPGPVSRTTTRICTCAGPTGSASRRTTTSPWAVNFTALPSTLVITWRTRSGSPTTRPGTAGVAWLTRSRLFSCAIGASSAQTSSTTSRTSNTRSSRRTWPASIFEKSRMSLMTASSAPAERCAVSARRRCSVLSGVASSSSVMPSTPFMGVRTSWLMLARNVDLARLASSATSCACRRCSTSRRRPSFTASVEARAAVRSRTRSSFSKRSRNESSMRSVFDRLTISMATRKTIKPSPEKTCSGPPPSSRLVA